MRHTKLILGALFSLGIGLSACTGNKPGSDAGDLSSSGDMVSSGGDMPGGDLTSSSGDLSGGGSDMTSSADLATGADMATIPACTQWATAVCAAVQTCSSHDIEVLYGDMDTCVTRVGLDCPSRLAAAGTTLTTTQLTACATALSTPVCADFLIGDQPTACQPVAGKLTVGAACGEDAQCASTFCKLGANLCGKCTARAALNGACTVTADCEFGLMCDALGAAAGKCVKPGALGTACSAAAPCDPTLVCNAATAKCIARLASGATCNPALVVDECDINQGLACDTKTKKCASVTYAKAGASCVAGTVPVYCVDGGVCSPTTHKCVAAAADDGACGGVTVIACESPATCQDKKCTPPDPASCK